VRQYTQPWVSTRGGDFGHQSLRNHHVTGGLKLSKKFLYHFIVCCLLATILFPFTTVCVEKITPSPVPSPSPRLSLSSDAWDFGEIDVDDSEKEHTFIIKNTGETVLSIESVTPTCDCTAVLLSTSKIPPGKQANLKVSFNVKDLNLKSLPNGYFVRAIMIESNDPVEPVKKITICARIVGMEKISNK
jgi:hypothetical protein